jgi:putative tryptophan/tyrosine transport system substrate-binding protein
MVAFFQSVLAIAQPSERARSVGVLMGIAESDPDAPRRVIALRQGLQELGWTEGKNLRIFYRWTAEPELVPVLAKELVAQQPDVIVASSSFVLAMLLRETRTAPIVFVTAADPVGDGFVTSLARPGGNAAGYTNNLASMGGKWLELLREIAPGVTRVGVMFNRTTAPGGGTYFLEPTERAAKLAGVHSFAAPLSDPVDVESVFSSLASEPGGGLIVMPDNFTTIHRRLITAKATEYHIPVIYPFRYFAVDGGLLSYGADLIDLYRRTGSLIDRILKGAKPAELPIQSPAKFELVINLNTARQLGVTVNKLMLGRADEVIE